MLEPMKVVRRSAELFGMTVEDITGPRRHQHVVHARHITALVLKDLGLTDSAIGRRINRERTVARDAWKNAEELIPRRPYLQYLYERLLMEVAESMATSPIEKFPDPDTSAPSSDPRPDCP